MGKSKRQKRKRQAKPPAQLTIGTRESLNLMIEHQQWNSKHFRHFGTMEEIEWTEFHKTTLDAYIRDSRVTLEMRKTQAAEYFAVPEIDEHGRDIRQLHQSNALAQAHSLMDLYCEAYCRIAKGNPLQWSQMVKDFHSEFAGLVSVWLNTCIERGSLFPYTTPSPKITSTPQTKQADTILQVAKATAACLLNFASHRGDCADSEGFILEYFTKASSKTSWKNDLREILAAPLCHATAFDPKDPYSSNAEAPGLSQSRVPPYGATVYRIARNHSIAKQSSSSNTEGLGIPLRLPPAYLVSITLKTQDRLLEIVTADWVDDRKGIVSIPGGTFEYRTDLKRAGAPGDIEGFPLTAARVSLEYFYRIQTRANIGDLRPHILKIFKSFREHGFSIANMDHLNTCATSFITRSPTGLFKHPGPPPQSSPPIHIDSHSDAWEEGETTEDEVAGSPQSPSTSHDMPSALTDEQNIELQNYLDDILEATRQTTTPRIWPATTTMEQMIVQNFSRDVLPTALIQAADELEDANLTRTAQSTSLASTRGWSKAHDYFAGVGQPGTETNRTSAQIHAPDFEADTITLADKIQKNRLEGTLLQWQQDAFQTAYGVNWGLAAFLVNQSKVRSSDMTMSKYNPFDSPYRTLCMLFLNLRTAIMYHYLCDPPPSVKSAYFTSTNNSNLSCPWAPNRYFPFIDLRVHPSMARYCNNKYHKTPSTFISDVLTEMSTHINSERSSKWQIRTGLDFYLHDNRRSKWVITPSAELFTKILDAIVIMRWGIAEEPQLNRQYAGDTRLPQFVPPKEELQQREIWWWNLPQSEFFNSTADITTGAGDDSTQNAPTQYSSLEFYNKWMKESNYGTVSGARARTLPPDLSS